MLNLRAFSLVGLLLISLGCATTAADPQQQQIGYEVAQVLVAHHAYEQATPLLQRAVQATPNDPRVHTMLGLVLRDRQLYPQAEAELQQAYRLDPTLPDTCAAMGVLYDQWGRGEDAERWHRLAIAAAPHSADYYNNLGFSNYLRGNFAASVDAYEKALQRDPVNHRATNNLGFARGRLGDYAGAMRSFSQGGNRADALANLGLCYELSGDTVGARGLYQEAVSLDKRSETAQRNLAALVAKESLPPSPKEKPSCPKQPTPPS